MSAMASPGQPRSSPWAQEPQSRQLANASTPSSFLPIPDSSASPFHSGANIHNVVSEHSSPNYFGIDVENTSNPPDSNPGPHTQKNWDSLSHNASFVPSPRPHHLSSKSKPGFKSFTNHLKLGSAIDQQRNEAFMHGSPPSYEEPGMVLPLGKKDSPPLSSKYASSALEPSMRNIEGLACSKEHLNQSKTRIQDGPILQSSLDCLRQNSPEQSQSVASKSFQGNDQDLRRRASENINNHGFSAFDLAPSRAKTFPIHSTVDNATAVSVERCAELLRSVQSDVMLLDVRPYAHFAQAHIQKALNLCIPTTLLKRPSFDTRKLEATFTDEVGKQKFARWRDCRFIIVYDATTSDPKDAGPLSNVLKKFIAEGWDGEGLFLKGGFKAFSDRCPDLVQRQQRQPARTSSNQPFSMSISLPSIAPVVGGCALPESSSVANPFFGNIRQNMDLVGGVGQIAIKLPEELTDSKKKLLPSWLRAASDTKDQGRNVSEKFLNLEKKELERMRQALSYDNAQDHTSSGNLQGKFRVAGIEKGTKNRYNDIYPFDHSRVRLQDVPAGGCDYVNANHMKAEFSNKSYIATQAPVPDTFNDFWRVVWEQDVRVIVSLTAEIERGHVKCHPYWKSGDYGPLKLKCFAHRHIHMHPKDSQQNEPYQRGPSSAQQESIKSPFGAEKVFNEHAEEIGDDPVIIVRHFSLSHSAFPFQPLREITQLQYPYWPDFGTTSQPGHLLKLIEQCNKVIRATSITSFDNNDAEPWGQRPVLVHCSAGCGRTGAFCTVDSVLDMLKRQRAEGTTHFGNAGKEMACGDGWVNDEQLDLVAKTVEDFRTQRPSMVQNLSQFVLCYESVLEWFVSQIEAENSPEAIEKLAA